MSFEEELTIPELLEYLVELDLVGAEIETFLTPWGAVQGAVVVCLLAVVVYFLFLKKVGDSDMDSLFKLIFRLQATQSLVNATLLLTVLITSAINSRNGALHLFLCRFITSVGISLNVGFIFSLLVIALIRVAYIVFPIYIHSLPKAVLQVAIIISWMVIVCGFFVCLYHEEVWRVQGVYYCLGLSSEDIDHPVMLSVIFPVINAITVLAYIFIFVQQFTRKVPRRRQQVQKLATLTTCITQFLLQGLNLIPFIYFRTTLRQEVFYFRVTMLHYALVESVVSPGILMLVMRYGDSIPRIISRVFPQCS